MEGGERIGVPLVAPQAPLQLREDENQNGSTGSGDEGGVGSLTSDVPSVFPLFLVGA